jgi:DNA-binding transcriptional regulator/RsmH inhibitor MraZ
MGTSGTTDEAKGTGTAPDIGLPAFGHAPFSGTHRTKLEANGRLVLPAAFRAPFVAAGDAHVMVRRGQLLWLMTPLAFELAVEDAAERQPPGMLDPETRARAFKGAPTATVDKQARLVIPSAHRDLLGFTGETEVVLSGAIQRLELWPAALFDEIEAPRIAIDVDLMFEGHEGLSTKRS